MSKDKRINNCVILIFSLIKLSYDILTIHSTQKIRIFKKKKKYKYICVNKNRNARTDFGQTLMERRKKMLENPFDL